MLFRSATEIEMYWIVMKNAQMLRPNSTPIGIDRRKSSHDGHRRVMRVNTVINTAAIHMRQNDSTTPGRCALAPNELPTPQNTVEPSTDMMPIELDEARPRRPGAEGVAVSVVLIAASRHTVLAARDRKSTRLNSSH